MSEANKSQTNEPIDYIQEKEDIINLEGELDFLKQIVLDYVDDEEYKLNYLTEIYEVRKILQGLREEIDSMA